MGKVVKAPSPWDPQQRIPLGWWSWWSVEVWNGSFWYILYGEQTLSMCMLVPNNSKKLWSRGQVWWFQCHLDNQDSNYGQFQCYLDNRDVILILQGANIYSIFFFYLFENRKARSLSCVMQNILTYILQTNTKYLSGPNMRWMYMICKYPKNYFCENVIK